MSFFGPEGFVCVRVLCTTVFQIKKSVSLVFIPNHQRWYAEWKYISVGIYTHRLRTRFCTFGADLYAYAVLFNKISPSSSVGSLLRVSCWLGRRSHGGNFFFSCSIDAPESAMESPQFFFHTSVSIRTAARAHDALQLRKIDSGLGGGIQHVHRK